MLYPEPGYAPAVARDPEFHLAQRRSSVATFPMIGAFLNRNVDLVPLYSTYHGIHVLMTLADLRVADPGEPVRERDLTGLRDRFGVSRAHIRNIIVATEGAGLVAWVEEDRKGFTLTPRGLAAVDLFIANTLASHDLTYRLALAGMGRDPGVPARQAGRAPPFP